MTKVTAFQTVPAICYLDCIVAYARIVLYCTQGCYPARSLRIVYCSDWIVLHLCHLCNLLHREVLKL